MNTNTCIICWLPDNVSKLQLVPKLKTNCECNPFIHEECLTSWLSHSLSCPICRSLVSINATANRNRNTNASNRNRLIAGVVSIIFTKTIEVINMVCMLIFMNIWFQCFCIVFNFKMN